MPSGTKQREIYIGMINKIKTLLLQAACKNKKINSTIEAFFLIFSQIQQSVS